MFFAQTEEMNIDSSQEFFRQNLLDKYHPEIMFQGNLWEKKTLMRQLSSVEQISIFTLF